MDGNFEDKIEKLERTILEEARQLVERYAASFPQKRCDVRL